VAIAAFEQWMRQLPSAPKSGVDLVRDVADKHRASESRARFRCFGRTATRTCHHAWRAEALV
jgi:hypothetical protein